MLVAVSAVVAVLIALPLLVAGMIWGEIQARCMIRDFRADFQWLITVGDSGPKSNSIAPTLRPSVSAFGMTISINARPALANFTITERTSG